MWRTSQSAAAKHYKQQNNSFPLTLKEHFHIKSLFQTRDEKPYKRRFIKIYKRVFHNHSIYKIYTKLYKRDKKRIYKMIRDKLKTNVS